jgi:NAD-dependent deacetylase
LSFNQPYAPTKSIGDTLADSNQSINDLATLLDAAKCVAIFTGAGISTESGIPDFRSPGGIWTKMQPIDFQDFVASEEMRRESWRRKLSGKDKMANAEPNRGHRAVAALTKSGKAPAVITQNVDGLHQRSGIADDAMIELHGNATYASCLDCQTRFELGPILAVFSEDETLPICDRCGGMIKTATISFGQSMPEEEMMRAQEATLRCDLFIAIGSSLVVHPAAGFPMIAKQNGAKLVILNREPTGLDDRADLVLNKEIGVTLGGAVGIE